MAKTDKTYVDRFVAEELGLRYQSLVVNVKSILQPDIPLKAMYFLFYADGIFWLDKATVISHRHGYQLKPKQIRLPKQIVYRINKRIYRRWYCVINQNLYRLKPLNGHDFKYIFGEANEPTTNSIPIPDIEYPLTPNNPNKKG